MSTSELSVMSPHQTAGDLPGAVPIRLRFLSASSRAEALFIWRRLEIDLCNQRMTCSSVWTEVWLNHYGSLVPHQYAIGMRGASVCAIALLTQGVAQYAGPFTLKTWHVGTAGEPVNDSACVEHNTVLASPEDKIEFTHALWSWAINETGCDEFRMDGFESTAVQPLLARYPQSLVDLKPCYFFDLASVRASSEDPLNRLGPHTRGNIRRTMRELGETQIEWAETVDRAESLFHELVQLHQARWNEVGKPGAYASRQFHDFHLELIHRMVPLGMMTVFGVQSGGRLIGCNQVLIDGRRVLHYQNGRVTSKGRVSYGTLTDYLCICDCLQRGYDIVDFLAGDGEHKRRLSTGCGQIAWVKWRRLSWKNTAIDALRLVKQATERISRSDDTSTRVSYESLAPVSDKE